jgi:hypothetical protein
METCQVSEHETKLFGDWYWGGLLKSHWELLTTGPELLSDDSFEPDVEPAEVTCKVQSLMTGVSGCVLSGVGVG